MSQGPAVSCTPSSSPHDEKYNNRLPPLGSRILPPIESTNRHGLLQDVPPNLPANQRSLVRPQTQLSNSPDQRCSRPIGVQNLLNPTTGGDSSSTHNQNRRRNAEHVESPPSVIIAPILPRVSTPSLPTTSIMNRSPVDVSLPNIPPSTSVYTQSMGRTHSSRSPSAYVPSPVTMNKPTATMDVKQSPFVLPRDYTNGGGSGGFSLPDMASTTQMPGEPYVHALPPNGSPLIRRASQDSSRHSRRQSFLDPTGGIGTGSHQPTSQSDSPSTQYSSYSQISQTPPAAVPSGVSTGQPQSFFSTQFAASGSASAMPQMTFDNKEYDAPPSSTTGGSIRVMTLETEHGPIQVPVDVQAASKVADEKRKRNATASHRFRQRRKEKERETSQNIAKLEQQIREMEEDREHYRRERDYFRDVAVRNQGAHIGPRPISPRSTRHASMDMITMQYQSSEGNGRSSGRNTRRRTSGYVPPTGPAPQPTEPHSTLPHFEPGTSTPATHAQADSRPRLQESFPLKTGPFDPSTTR